MTLFEGVIGVVVTIGAIVIYAGSRREYPDKLFAGGLLVAVAAAVLLDVTGATWAFVLSYGGLSIAAAVTLADLEQHLVGSA